MIVLVYLKKNNRISNFKKEYNNKIKQQIYHNERITGYKKTKYNNTKTTVIEHKKENYVLPINSKNKNSPKEDTGSIPYIYISTKTIITHR